MQIDHHTYFSPLLRTDHLACEAGFAFFRLLPMHLEDEWLLHLFPGRNTKNLCLYSTGSKQTIDFSSHPAGKCLRLISCRSISIRRSGFLRGFFDFFPRLSKKSLHSFLVQLLFLADSLRQFFRKGNPCFHRLDLSRFHLLFVHTQKTVGQHRQIVHIDLYFSHYYSSPV